MAMLALRRTKCPQNATWLCNQSPW